MGGIGVRKFLPPKWHVTYKTHHKKMNGKVAPPDVRSMAWHGVAWGREVTGGVAIASGWCEGRPITDGHGGSLATL